MALEKRDGNLYYYRSVRRGAQVRKVYVGSGELARIAHERDLMNRAKAKLAEEHERQEDERSRERLEALAAPVLALSEASDIIARAHLIASGCHRHKGEWRRKRSAS